MCVGIRLGSMKVKIKNIILLQLIVIIYTFTGLLGKFSADKDFLSFEFVAFYAGEIAVLGVYALLWQQMIKRFELSVAYANRAMALLWSAIWAVVIFHDRLTVQNIIGIILVIAGTIVVNMDEGASDVTDTQATVATPEEGGMR